MCVEVCWTALAWIVSEARFSAAVVVPDGVTAVGAEPPLYGRRYWGYSEDAAAAAVAASVGAAVAVLVAKRESTRRAENATLEWAEGRL